MPQTDGRTDDRRRTTDEFWFHELCWHSQAELIKIGICTLHILSIYIIYIFFYECYIAYLLYTLYVCYHVYIISPECRAVLSDFHREQNWKWWVYNINNVVARNRDHILTLLRRCAHAICVEAVVEWLRACDLWTQNDKLKTWFCKSGSQKTYGTICICLLLCNEYDVIMHIYLSVADLLLLWKKRTLAMLNTNRWFRTGHATNLFLLICWIL